MDKNYYMYHYRKISVVVFYFIVFSAMVSAQNYVTGIVKDSSLDQPLEFTQVALFTPDDTSLVTGGITDISGRFRIESAPGKYLLRISFIGYRDLWKEVEITSGRSDVGSLALIPSVSELDEVTVTAAASLFRSEVDRRIYNVENTTIAEGGTAIQLLETLPSIQVDDQGNISLRGSSNVLIYINGRPTNILSDDMESFLEQYPANAIKSVELITNPSARYDAEGIGGIINIILTESKMQGFNGQVNLSSGTGHKYSGGLNLNYRYNKINFFTNYSYQYRERWQTNVSNREYFGGEVSPILEQDYHTTNYDQSHLIRPGMDIEINDHHSARVYANINYRSRDRKRTYNIRNMGFNNQMDSLFVRDLNEDQSRINYEIGINYHINGNDNGTELTIMASHAYSDQDRIEYFDQRNYFSEITEDPFRETNQTYERPVTNQLSLLQVDYQRPITESFDMEAGLRSTISTDDRSQTFQDYDFNTNQFVINDLITNQFEFEEQIHAAYLMARNQFEKFGFQIGLRGEYTLTESYQPTIDEVYENNYFHLFPSVNLSYKLTEVQDIQASYSRRIRRPRVWSLMPFINAQDFMNLRIGNPYLEPEHTDNYEINYIRNWEKYMFTTSLFHRNTTNALTRVFELFGDNSAIVTWTNANTRNATGIEVINYLNLSNNFNATLTGNFFHSTISGDNNGEAFSNSDYSWTLNLLSNWRIPKLFNLQVMGFYRGPIVIPQGYIDPMFSLNLGIRRNILKQQGTLSFNVSDVFNSRKFRLVTEGPQFNQSRTFERESLVATISFTYRFRGYNERGRSRDENDVNGEIDSLY